MATPYVPPNPDIGTALEPGIFSSFNFTGSGAANVNTDRSAHLMGYRLSSGAGTADTPTLYTQQSDVDADHGRGSEVSRLFAAFNSQYGAGQFEVWCTGITPASGGTAATYTWTLGGTATATGQISLSVNGYALATSVAVGDTATTVATALYGKRQALLDSGVTVSDSGSGTLTFTYVHKGVTGNDCPFVLQQDGAAGITVSNGVLTYATGVTGAGSATVTMGGTTITAAIANSDTAAQAATKVATAINTASPPAPFYCTDNSSGVLTLYPRNGRAVRRLSAAIVTSTGITVTPSLHGTAGAGTPTLTGALTNAAALSRGWAAWVPSFCDATSAGAFITHGESEGNGVVQKNQAWFYGSTATLATAGAIATAASPALTSMLNSGQTVYWVKDGPQQQWEYAARMAAIYLYSTYYPQNLDGQRLRTRGSVPLGAPHLVDRPNRSDREAAMQTYYMTVGMVDSAGYVTIERAMTCSNASNTDLHEVAVIRQVHTTRPALNQYLADRFTGKSLKTTGTPKTSNTVSPTSVRDAVVAFLQGLDDQDRYDGIDTYKSAVACTVDPSVSGRLRIFVPLAIVRSLHQLTPVITPV